MRVARQRSVLPPSAPPFAMPVRHFLRAVTAGFPIPMNASSIVIFRCGVAPAWARTAPGVPSASSLPASWITMRSQYSRLLP